MSDKILERSRYAGSVEILENGGRVIFIPHRVPILNKEFNDNIIHTVRDSDRVDSLSSLYYGTPDYGWVISDFNNFLFPDDDLHSVVTIILPSLATLLSDILPNLE